MSAAGGGGGEREINGGCLALLRRGCGEGTGPDGGSGDVLLMLGAGLWLEVQEVSPANGAHMLGRGGHCLEGRPVIGERGNGGRIIKDRLRFK